MVFICVSRGNGFLHRRDGCERIDDIILLLLPMRVGGGRAAVYQPIITKPHGIFTGATGYVGTAYNKYRVI